MDPLSTATRATKRNLLITAILAISANAFNVKVDKIPVGGLSITFDDHLFAFLLLITLLYFFCTFVLYYFIDIKNIEETEHQKQSELQFQTSEVNFRNSFQSTALRDLREIAGKGYVVRIPNEMSHRWLPKEIADPAAAYWLERRPEQGRNVNLERLARGTVPEIEAKIDRRMSYWMRKFRFQRRILKMTSAGRVTSVRLTYILRNYVFDGALPIILGLLAMLATFKIIHLEWLQSLFPILKSQNL